jgi:hypothetical protein
LTHTLKDGEEDNTDEQCTEAIEDGLIGAQNELLKADVCHEFVE